MTYSTCPVLGVASKQVETELGARLPRKVSDSPSAMSPTLAVIHVESGLAQKSASDNSTLVRDVPEWLLTSRPMSRAHVYLISCLLLPVKQALRPFKSKIRNDGFFSPWPAYTGHSPSSSTGFVRDENLSYVEQLRCWHEAALDMGKLTGGKIARRIHQHILEPGSMLIHSVYVRVLLQMATDAMGSYYVEHDLTLLNLDGITRQASEGGGSAGHNTPSGDYGTTLDIKKENTTRRAENGVWENSFLRLLRRHSAS